ncbi:hypothetical protein [Paenibacillus sp. FSL K6-1230]|uniref:hypothetical protein n=1 Tax=Paenibacillus sp. FSL K6-1230 TaxID=2921603 RepID=UPI0030FB2CB6
MEAQNAAPTPAIYEAVNEVTLWSRRDQPAWPEMSMLELLDTFEPTMHELARFIPIPREDALQSMRLELLEHFRWNSSGQRERSSGEEAFFDYKRAVCSSRRYIPLKWK